MRSSRSGTRRSAPSPAACRRRSRRGDTSPVPGVRLDGGCGARRPARAQRRRGRLIAARLGQVGEPVEAGDQEPGQPDAFALALAADPVHAVVPVAVAHQRQAVGAQYGAPIRGRGRSGRRASRIRPRRPAGRSRHPGRASGAGPSGRERARRGWPRRRSPPRSEQATNGSQSGSSAMRVRMPRPAGGCHQCCTSPSRNWRPAARRIWARASSGRRVDQRHHVLELVAEPVRAARLVERRAPPDAAARAPGRAASG